MSGGDEQRLGFETDLFGRCAPAYALSRPRYPDALFDWIAATSPGRGRAWDCATGNGQAAAGLASRFAAVHASDLSPDMIRRAERRDNIFYAVGRAEASPFASGAFDLIVVAQALHWLDTRRFWPEVARVTRKGALFCAWGYVAPETLPEIEDTLIRPFRKLIAPFWAPNNRLLWRGYRAEDLGFPFETVAAPRFAIRAEWTLEELIGFMSTWSACARARKHPPAAAALDELLANSRSATAPDVRLPISLPLELLAGRV